MAFKISKLWQLLLPLALILLLLPVYAVEVDYAAEQERFESSIDSLEATLIGLGVYEDAFSGEKNPAAEKLHSLKQDYAAMLDALEQRNTKTARTKYGHIFSELEGIYEQYNLPHSDADLQRFIGSWFENEVSRIERESTTIEPETITTPVTVGEEEIIDSSKRAGTEPQEDFPLMRYLPIALLVIIAVILIVVFIRIAKKRPYAITLILPLLFFLLLPQLSHAAQSGEITGYEIWWITGTGDVLVSDVFNDPPGNPGSTQVNVSPSGATIELRLALENTGSTIIDNGGAYTANGRAECNKITGLNLFPGEEKDVVITCNLSEHTMPENRAYAIRFHAATGGVALDLEWGYVTIENPADNWAKISFVPREPCGANPALAGR